MSDFWQGYIAGAMFAMLGMVLAFFLVYWRSRRKKKWDPIKVIQDTSEANKQKLVEFEDFDIDYNVVRFLRETEFDRTLQMIENSTSQPSLRLVPPNLEELIELRLERDDDGRYKYCGQLNPNPAVPYACTKPAGHEMSLFGPQAKHGHAGIFWD